MEKTFYSDDWPVLGRFQAIWGLNQLMKITFNQKWSTFGLNYRILSIFKILVTSWNPFLFIAMRTKICIDIATFGILLYDF